MLAVARLLVPAHLLALAWLRLTPALCGAGGWRTSGTGVCPASCGGVTGSLPTTSPCRERTPKQLALSMSRWTGPFQLPPHSPTFSCLISPDPPSLFAMTACVGCMQTLCCCPLHLLLADYFQAAVFDAHCSTCMWRWSFGPCLYPATTCMLSECVWQHNKLKGNTNLGFTMRKAMKSISMGLMSVNSMRASAKGCCSRRERALSPTSALPLLMHGQVVAS